MARKDKNKSTEKESSKIMTVIIALLIAIIWFAIFGFLIKLDVGGFGSGVLRPIIKDVPIINKILPGVSEEQLSAEKGYEYRSLAEAVARIKELELIIEDMENQESKENEDRADLLAELERLRIFEKTKKNLKKDRRNLTRRLFLQMELLI